MRTYRTVRSWINLVAITFLVTLAVLIGLALAYAGTAHAETIHRCDSNTASVDGHDTSCAFAHNVGVAWFSQPGNPVLAYSPVTGRVYRMACAGGFDLTFDDGTWVRNAKRCLDVDGGNAVAYVW